MPFGYGLWWAQISMCYIGCTLAQPGEYDRTVLCGGDAPFFQTTLVTYFGCVRQIKLATRQFSCARKMIRLQHCLECIMRV